MSKTPIQARGMLNRLQDYDRDDHSGDLIDQLSEEEEVFRSPSDLKSRMPNYIWFGESTI